MKTLGPALLLVLSVLSSAAAFAEPPAALEARLEPAIAAARDLRDRLDGAAATSDPAAPDARAAVRELLRRLHAKLIVIRSLTPDAPPPRAQSLRMLEEAVDRSAREEPTAARLAEISTRFEELFPSPGGPRSFAGVAPTPPPPSPGADRALSAVADAAARGRAAIGSPGLFYDGRASGNDAVAGPAQAVSAAARPPAGRGVPAPAPAAAVPPPAAGPVENCEKALAGALLSVDGLCRYSPAGASVLSGLLDAVREQFMTVTGVALNLVFMLMGIAFAALTGGIGLIVKLLFAVGMTAFAVYKLIPALTAAVKALWNSKEGSPERYAATRLLSGLLGGVLIMALMGAVGVKLGGALPASFGAKIASLNAKASAKLLPAGVTAMLAKFTSKPAAKPEATDALRRSGKSQALYTEEAVLRNAELPNRAARVKAAMEQLGVDRPFAEKVFAAHRRVPCEVGACTPAQLRAKLEIMGAGPKAEAAIRSGLAGSAPRLSMKSPLIRDFLKKHAPDEWRRTIDKEAASGANHIDKHHSPSLPDWARDGPGSLQSRIKPDGIQFATKFNRETDLKASVAELRRLIRRSVELGPRTEVGRMTWSRPYRPAAYYRLLEKLARGEIAEFTVQFRMSAPVGRGMGFDAAGRPAITYGLRWVRATLVRTEEGIVIKTIYPAAAAP